MQILRTRGTKYQGWGGYINCITQPHCLPELVFRYMPKTSTKYLTYAVDYSSGVSGIYNDMPIGMSADACIQYWEDL